MRKIVILYMHTITELEDSDEEFEVDDNTFQTQPTATLEDSLIEEEHGKS